MCLVKASLLWSLAFLILKGASSAHEPKCEISCRSHDCPKDEETVDPDSITPSHCSIKNGRNISRNMTWKEVNDKITPKAGLQCLVLKTGNSEKRIYFASQLTVTTWGSPVFLYENHTSQRVKCMFKGRPRPQITWYKDGSNLKTFNHTEEVEQLKDNGILQVTTTLHVPGREEFAGIYHCFGNNSLSSGWSSSKEPKDGIELLFACLGINFTRSGPEEIAANAFSNITLSCLVAKNVAELDDFLVTWNFKNQSDPLKAGGKYRIPALEPITSCRRAFKLEIINVTENDEGVYSCHQTCKDSAGDVCKDSAQFELKVHSPRPKEYSPPLTKTVSNLTEADNKTTSLAAEAPTVLPATVAPIVPLPVQGSLSADEPKCEISCRLGDGPKDEETVDPDSIILSYCSIKNGGNISRNMTWKEVNDKVTPKPGVQCLVMKTGNSEKRIYFASPLTVTRSGSPISIFGNHTSQDVKCVFKGRPRPQITWYKDGSNLKTFNHTEVVALLENGIFQVNTTLHVPYREEFAGVYHCFGNNSLISGWSSSKEPESGIELFFRCSGINIIRSGPTKTKVNAFSNITLSCLVARSVAELEYLLMTWNFNNQSEPLKTGGKYRIPALDPISSCKRAFKLEITNVTADDEGVYSCHQSCKYNGEDFCKSSARLELKVYSPRPKEYSPPLTKTVSNLTEADDKTTSLAAEASTVQPATVAPIVPQPVQGSLSADEPKCEISCRLGDGPKDEETVDPDSIIPPHCSIKNGGNISRNMTWKEVNDKITPKPGVQCLVMKTGNSEKRIYFASPLTVTRWGSPAFLYENKMNRKDVKCIFKGRPRPHITWYKDGCSLKTFNHTEVVALLDNGIFQVTTTLHVPGREEFAGVYFCFGNNSLISGWSSSKESESGIELLFRCLGFRIERSGPKEIAANAFSNVTLSCLVAKTDFEPDDLLVTWNFKNQSDPLKTGGKYRVPALEQITSCRRAFKLEIINVTADDEGVYKCHQSCKYNGEEFCKSSARLELKVYTPGTEAPVVPQSVQVVTQSKPERWLTTVLAVSVGVFVLLTSVVIFHCKKKRTYRGTQSHEEDGEVLLR